MLPLLLFLLAGQQASAQITPSRPAISKPQANPRQITLPDVLFAKWKGARITNLPGAVNVDSLWIEFHVDGTLNFKHQKFEFNGPAAGTWTMSGNSITIIADKFPFIHTLNGTWNVNTGVISGSFKEVREKDATQPSYYTSGSNTGTFNLSRN